MKKSLNFLSFASLIVLAGSAVSADGDFAFGDMKALERTLTDEANFSKAQYRKIEVAITDQIIDSLASDLAEARLVGGERATQGELPWMVALIARKSNGTQIQFCGGTLIAKNKVLTAAHCYVVPEKAMFVSVNRADITPPLAGLIAVSKVTTHPNYLSPKKGNDVAVITLAGDSSATPLPLMNVDPTIPENTLLYANIAGWGLTSEGGLPSLDLLKAEVPYATRAQCVTAYPTLPANTLCAGFKTGGIDTCQGDSGGPLYSGDAVVGITSYGFGCARMGYYGVYTSVAAFHTWIAAQ